MSLIKKQEPEVQKANRLEVTPASRVSEGADAFTLTLELPGVGEKDIELTIEHRTLTVSAENTVQQYKDHALTLAEIPEVRFRAAFELPERVDTSGIRASSKDGVLALTLPKREEVKPRRIAIAAG
jgi:HSP20 family molecular chaperone IbpA